MKNRIVIKATKINYKEEDSIFDFLMSMNIYHLMELYI